MNFFFKVKLPFLQWNLKIAMNYLHFLSAKQSCTAQWGQQGHIFQVLRRSLMCTDFLLLKIKTLPLHLDCRAGVLFSSSHKPQPPSSAWEGSAAQVPPSCYVLPQGNQNKENNAHLRFFLAQGQHVASRYHTSHGTDITGSEWTLHCSCAPLTS